LVISWPARIKDGGGIRNQFHHVIDLAPTILEAAGVSQPVEVNGVRQKPIEGVSMLYTFGSADAKEQRPTQYFEMFGNRAIYHDGWVATVRHGRLPWQNAGSFDFGKDRWELYNVAEDYSESRDLSAQQPEKLKELQALFLTEARKYNVLPLDDRFAERADPRLRPSLIEGRNKFTYFSGTAHVPESSAANTKNASHTMTVYLEVPKGGADGVLVAEGGTASGFALYVKAGKPTYEYNWFGQARYRVRSPRRLSPGPATIRVDFKSDGGVGKGGQLTLFIDGTQVAQGRVEKTVPARFSADETFDLGLDSGSPVSSEYRAPFRFAGTIKKVEIEISPNQLSTRDRGILEKLALEARLGLE
jgi:arylsulfatase